MSDAARLAFADSRAPVHDWSSHGADAFRYLAITSRLDAEEFSGMNRPRLEKLYPRWAKQSRPII
jgi:hypothetical protein